MSQMGHALGKTVDEQKYQELFEKIRAAFNAAYVRPDGFVGGVPPPPVFASGTATTLSDKSVETQNGVRACAAHELATRFAAQCCGKAISGSP